MQDIYAYKKPDLRPEKFVGCGWTGRIRTYECWDQNPVPYRLATVQSSTILAQKDYSVDSGFTPIRVSRLCMRAFSSSYFVT